MDENIDCTRVRGVVMDDNINNIATDMRMLAAEIGGGHHSNKESEKILLDLAKRLDKVGCDTILLIDRTFRDSMLLTGHSMCDIDRIKRQNDGEKLLRPAEP